MPARRLLLLVLLLAAAPLRSADSEAIAGAVLDAAGRPVAGAEVWLLSDEIPVEEWERQLAAGPTAVTGADGRFRLPRPASIPYGTALYVCRSGLDTGFEPVFPDSPGQFLFRLGPAAVLAGRVLDAHGRPVPEAVVTLSVPGEHPGCPTGRWYPCIVNGIHHTRTDGRFVFDFLPPGWYEVAASADGHLRTVSPATRVAAGGRADIELRLGTGAAVSGLVRTATGGPAADVKVCADGFWQCGVTAADGSYRLTGLRPQPAVEVRALDLDRGEARQEVEIAAPETRVDLVLDGRPGRHLIQGRLLGPDGTPLAGRELTFWDGDWSAGTVTGADGSFELRLEPRSYVGFVRQPDGTVLEAVPAFNVGDGPRRVELHLAPGTIEGRVLGLAPGETAVVELPLLRFSPWNETSRVDPDGRYRFAGVKEGSWTLTATADGRTAKGRVALSRGGMARLDLVFRPAWEVSGRVLDPDGRPVPGIEIRFRRGPEDDLFKTESRADGSFARFLEVGDYRVEVWGEGPIRLLPPLSIAPGGATGLELRLPPPVTLTGRVLGLAAGEQATLSVLLDGSPSRAVASDGRYRVSDVAPGVWPVMVEVRDAGLYPAGASFSVPVEIPAGDVEVDFDIEVPRGPYGVTVTADGARVLWLHAIDAKLKAWTAADRDGLFRFGRLPAGRYSLGTSMVSGESDPEIELGEDTDRDLRIELPPTR